MKKKSTPIDILYEDRDVVVLAKPQNLPIQPDKQSSLSLLTQLKDYYEFAIGIDDPFVGLIHRLDRHTGGVCIFAKNKNALRHMNSLFASHQVDKRYLAVVLGSCPSEGHLEHHLSIDQRSNFVRVVPADTKESVKAALSYQKLTEATLSDMPVSLVEVKLETGRQHQIRVQFAALGFPLLGDAKYGKCPIKNESLALWAYKLSVDSQVFTSVPSLTNQYFNLFSFYFDSNQFKGVLSS